MKSITMLTWWAVSQDPRDQDGMNFSLLYQAVAYPTNAKGKKKKKKK